MASHLQLALIGHSAIVASVAWSPAAKRLATGSWDSTAKVWDAESGKEMLILRGHGDTVSIRDRRGQMLEIPKGFNEVLQCDFTDYQTEDDETYHIGGVTEYLSRFNLVSKVLDTETAFDLIDVTERAMREIANMGHAFPKRIVLVTDNGPAMQTVSVSERT